MALWREINLWINILFHIHLFIFFPDIIHRISKYAKLVMKLYHRSANSGNLVLVTYFNLWHLKHHNIIWNKIGCSDPYQHPQTLINTTDHTSKVKNPIPHFSCSQSLSTSQTSTIYLPPICLLPQVISYPPLFSSFIWPVRWRKFASWLPSHFSLSDPDGSSSIQIQRRKMKP